MRIKREEFIEKWLEALESGDYKQGKGFLRQKGQKGFNNEFLYCCLGVACEVANQYSTVDYFDQEYDTDNLTLPKSLARFMGMEESGAFTEPVEYRGESFASLAALNDSGVKFKTIARIYREQVTKGNFEKS